MPRSEYSEHENDYRQSDVRVVCERGDWESWDDVIGWLEDKGERDDELGPGEAGHMLADFREARRCHDMFSEDPAELYVIAKSRCRHREAAA